MVGNGSGDHDKARRFARPRYLFLTRFIHWRDICFTMQPTRKTRRKNAICGRCAISIRFADRRLSRGSLPSCVTSAMANSPAGRALRARRIAATKKTKAMFPCGRRQQEITSRKFFRQRDAKTVRRLVAELPEPFREAIVLREINDLSYREIADAVGVPVGTVMSRLARARCMLRKAWIAEEEEESVPI